MILHYFRLAVRNIRKQAFFSAINVVGFSLGLACFTLILLHLVDEFSFDRFHAKGNQIYRMYSQISPGFRKGSGSRSPFLPMPLGPALQNEFQDITAFTRWRTWGGFAQAPKGLFEAEMVFVDTPFFRMFTFPLLYGTAESALADPYSVVLTEKMALKMFGEQNPVGRTIELKVEKGFEKYVVSGVAANVPSNSSFQFEILLPFERYMGTDRGKTEVDRWTRISFQTFVMLRPGSGLQNDTARLQEFYVRHHPDSESKARQQGWWTGTGSPFWYGLQPLRDMRHDISVEGSSVDPKYSWILLGIGALVLLIACINFTTLAIGRSANRAREIGIRKMVGASRKELAFQHLGEAMLISGLALLLALFIAFGALPMFNQLIDKNLAFNFKQFPELYLLLPALAVVAGLVAGAYPALVLSGFKPIETLRSKFRMGGENWFTRSLVTGQFVLSMGLITCTFIMLRQLHFLRNNYPGFNKDNVVMIDASGTDHPVLNAERFRAAVGSMPEVDGMSISEAGLGGGAGWSTSGFDYKGRKMQIFEYVVDPQYISTLGLQLLAGRNLDYAVVADTQTSVVINEAAMRAFGWSMSDVLGQRLTGYYDDNPTRDPEVVGVVKDYHFGSFKDEIEPMVLQMFSPFPRENYFVRLRPGYPGTTLNRLEQTWASVEPRLPFRYKFLDESLNNFYKNDQRWGKVISLAGSLSLFLACLGLLGLVGLATVNRTKEIGIRKVLGATVSALSALLAKDFLKLVLAAILIATPVAWYFMNIWLQSFATRIDLKWWMFALAGLATAIIASLTVSIQTIRAALANPVQSLRNE
jgi:putative ABC transport system permease protein